MQSGLHKAVLKQIWDLVAGDEPRLRWVRRPCGEQAHPLGSSSCAAVILSGRWRFPSPSCSPAAD
jgi:hypothetical protein